MIFFVPARKGSVRAPGKNTRLLAGKPLVSWTFEQILEVGLYPALVSSDDREVLKLATRHEGFLAHYRRPGLCQAQSKMSDVLLSHLPDFAGHDEVCVLYPTSPLRTSTQIKLALRHWKINGGPDKVLMSVTPVLHRPYGLMRIDESGFLRCNHPEGEEFYQAQNQPINYRANGAIYIIPRALLEKQEINSQLFNGCTLPFMMDEITSWEIDSEDDFHVVESFMSKKDELLLQQR